MSCLRICTQNSFFHLYNQSWIYNKNLGHHPLISATDFHLVSGRPAKVLGAD